MGDGGATGWGDLDITSDGRIVEECVRTPDRGRRIVWYDGRGRVARRENGTADRASRRGLSA